MGGGIPEISIETGKLINDKYKFGSERQATQHFITAQKTAREVIKNTIGTFGLPPDRFGQKTEVDIPDPNIKRMLLYTNPRSSPDFPQGTILDSRFEQLREFILADIALRLDKRAVEECSYEKMSELQFLFNKHLFDGPAGYTELKTKYVSHNDEHGIKKISNDYFDGATKIEEKMRVIVAENMKINVLVDFDKKSAARQIVKGLVDYHKLGLKEYDPLGADVDGKPSLQDRQRFSFVVDGDDKDIEVIHNKISHFFENLELKKIGNDTGQNPTVKARYIATYGGIPIEIIYYDIQGYKNSRDHIGKKNFNGLYSGSAHELFMIRRSLEILLYFFPFEVYGKQNQSQEEYELEMLNFARYKSEEVAQKIRGKK